MSVFNNINKLYLASASPRRRELAKAFGIPFEVLHADGNETFRSNDPCIAAEEIAVSKMEGALKVIPCPGSGEVILTADTSVWVDGKMFGKPIDREDTLRMLDAISGRTHEVISGFCLAYCPGGAGKPVMEEGHSKTTVEVDLLTDKEILEYADSGDPMDKAGAYGIQGVFSRHIRSIEGDYFNVVGLPVSEIYKSLKKIDRMISERR